METLAVGALGALVLLAVSVRLAAAGARRILAGGRRAGRAAAAAARTLGVRGLVAGLAGGTATVASAGAAAASPAPAAVSAPALALPSAPSVAHAAAARSATYVVRPGDSLWAIAARHLGPHASNAQIAAEWPRWYRANRAVIGSDPSLIHVGTRLVVPHPRRTGTSASTHHRPAHRDPGRSALTLDPDRR